ncbi:uncharacterized protein LOC126753768 [Bactrocera neohumeralis]|uniref:uncharacterized protein LOC126753768 n=1 Tax=Bactrocera neohumeralis TaxID=98809 RepID=UPI0021651D63|nr:uncharacterized protein LOC126753768 [Bactrocera neohumeralis]
MLPNKCTVHVLLVFAAVLNASVRGKSYRECIGFENEQKYVASQEDCAKYIYCDGKNSFEGACLADNYFNEKEGKCDERASVVCKVGQQLSGEDKPYSSQQGFGSGVASTDGLRVDPVNAFGGQLISQQQAKQEPQPLDGFGGGILGSEAVTGLALNAIDVGNTGSSTAMAQTPLCPRRYGLENVMYLPNTQSCAAYYVCYNGIAIPMICARNSYFNQETSHCERESNLYCPYDRPVRLICNRGVYDYIPHPRNCGYYYFCSNGYLMIFQCPFQYLWDYERRSCVQRSEAKCFSSDIAEAMLT